MNHLDGNVAAGVLARVFTAEVTGGFAVCGSCGRRQQVGAMPAYAHGMGVVLRCGGCDGAVIRIGRGGGRVWYDLRGLAVLELADA